MQYYRLREDGTTEPMTEAEVDELLNNKMLQEEQELTEKFKDKEL